MKREKDLPRALIYTDGSCDRNPGGNGGYSIIIFKDNKPIKISGYEPKTTNQRMELTAVIEGLDYFNEPHMITVCTDSAYVCNAHKNKWYNNWLVNGWKNYNGDPVANVDLWKKFLMVIDRHKVTIVKVKGHSDNIFNNECDIMAKDIIRFYKEVKNNIR